MLMSASTVSGVEVSSKRDDISLSKKCPAELNVERMRKSHFCFIVKTDGSLKRFAASVLVHSALSRYIL